MSFGSELNTERPSKSDAQLSFLVSNVDGEVEKHGRARAKEGRRKVMGAEILRKDKNVEIWLQN